MNIKSLLIAAVVACTGTMVANAQNPEILSNESALAQGVCGNNECGPKSKCNKGECAAFEGLNLTDAQKTALAQLKADRKNKAIEAKKQKRQADSLSRVARRAERLDYLHQIQKILTPDQYVTFLENTIVNNGGGKGFKPGKPGKGFNKGGRPDQCPNYDKRCPRNDNKDNKFAKNKKDRKDKKDKKD